MGKNKTRKYNEVAKFKNVIYLEDEESQKKLSKILEGKSRIVVELGCGKGEYCVNLAERYPDTFFIGIDIKGARLWTGARKALNENIENLIFLRMRIENIDRFFSEESISEIWITFPDPYLKRPWKNHKKRLTSERFLNIYRKVLKKDSVINFKTDDITLYEYTLETLKKTGAAVYESTCDLYSSRYLNELTSIKTTFEKKYLEENKKIKYVRFSIS